MVVKQSAIAIIQARMSSSRLPGKVLMPLAEKPVIEHIVQRARLCRKVGKVVVATSLEKSDDALAEYCNGNGIDLFRGSLNHVLSRYVTILKSNPYKYCVRITGDCPLISPDYIDAQIEALDEFDGDLIWMKRESSILEGQGVMSSNAIFTVNKKSDDPDDFEHVGSKYFIAHPESFKFINMQIPEKYLRNSFRLTIDELDDYEFMTKLYTKLWKGIPINLDEALIWMRTLAAPEITNQGVQHSSINKELHSQKTSFSPELAGSYSWRGI
jgi:spore coat polysaccharide biosynthesis protein SpsF